MPESMIEKKNYKRYDSVEDKEDKWYIPNFIENLFKK